MSKQTFKEKLEEIVNEAISDQMDYEDYYAADYEDAVNKILALIESDIVGSDENDRFLSYVSVQKTRAKNQLKQEQREKLK